MVATLGGEHAELLSQVELFRGLDRVTLAKLVAHLEPLSLSAGDILFRQGDPPDGLYLVSRGTFAIYAAAAEGSGDEITFSTCGRGESFGEIALLTSETRTATVRAQEDGELLRLDQARFLDLVRRDPSVGLAISAGLIRRLRAADAARLGLPGSTSASLPPPEPIQPAPRKIRWHPRQSIGLGLAVAVILIGWLLPPPTDLSIAGWHALISLVALVPILTLEGEPELGGLGGARSAIPRDRTCRPDGVYYLALCSARRHRSSSFTTGGRAWTPAHAAWPTFAPGDHRWARNAWTADRFRDPVAAWRRSGLGRGGGVRGDGWHGRADGRRVADRQLEHRSSPGCAGEHGRGRLDHEVGRLDRGAGVRRRG